MDKDAFLQLLVAQMKYQDPLEPTSNTEYISQYAQFSQVEALNNMSTTMELSRYSSYVGKEVVIESTDSSGKSTQTRGFVDYVTFEEGKAYFSIEGNLYKAEDMVTVISNEYSNAEDIAEQVAKTSKDLPVVDSINVNDHGNTINNLYNLYNSIGDYEKGFLDEDDVKAMNQYVAKLNEILVQLANEAAKEKEKEEAEKAAAEAANTQNAEEDATEIAENAASQGAVTPEED
jgi:flagellar basal-body rod modification protein FlgD